MSTWYEIKDREDVSKSDCGEFIEVLFDSDDSGNRYVTIPIEYINKSLKEVKSFPKKGRVKLSPAKYKELERKVMDRDACACGCCGQYANDKPHHIIYRSEQGNDVEENLSAICRQDHHDIHNGDMRAVVDRMCDYYGCKRVIQAVLLYYASRE